MAGPESVADLKRRLSTRLLEERGVSGVGLREGCIVVYLETADPGLRNRVEEVTRATAPGAPLLFEVAGGFGKR
jgi:hypothetical protein